MKKFLILLLLFIEIVSFCSKESENNIKQQTKKVIYAGARASNYGIYPFPAPSRWVDMVDAIAGNFEGSIPTVIWIVGVMYGDKDCYLFFPRPQDGKNYEHIRFHDFDYYEKYLSYFDEHNVKVFLQVEPANAEVTDLIELVLNRYKKHKCVIGFGVDVEWYREADAPDWGVKVSDSLAKAWENKVKEINFDYKLFLKHWDYRWMPPNYRGEIIFVDDSQIFPDFDSMFHEFIDYWSKRFYPNQVCFQVGYPSDYKWWKNMDNPVKEIGQKLIDSTEQSCGIFWVDFTLYKLFPYKR